MWKLIQVGLGDLGRRTASEWHRSELARVAAAVDADPRVAGRELAELVGAAEPGVRIAGSLAELDGLGAFDAACVMTRSRLADCAGLFRELLGAGLSVVSTCEELTWPWLRRPELAAELDALAKERGGRLLGVGVNPGFLMDVLPGLMSAACLEVESLRVERLIDASDRRAAFQRKIGAGASLEEHRASLGAGAAGHVGLAESLHLAAACCGLVFDSFEEEAVAIAAESELESAAGTIARGAAAGVRQTARGFSEGRLVAELVFDARLDQPEPGDRVLLEGRPPMEVRIPGGVHGDLATSALVLHALGPLLARPPGLWTMGDLIVSRGRSFRG